MEISIIENGPWILDAADEFLNKRIHLVCLSINALTTYNVYTTAIGGMSSEEAEKYASTVNIKNEVGTLYPKLNLTILPLSKYGKRNDFGNREIANKHILDCFYSNEKYIKSPKLIFALERVHDFDFDLALEVINELKDNYTFIYTKSIVFYNN